MEARRFIRELDEGDTHLAFEAMRALRTALDEESYLRRVTAQRVEGYRLIASFEDADDRAKAVAGFRTGHSLAWGFYLYVDDISTLPEARRRGHGAALMRWLFEEAGRLDCDTVHLNSGVGSARTDAHRLYLNHGMHITAHHFAARVKPRRPQ